jgi:hypothetical protein
MEAVDNDTTCIDFCLIGPDGSEVTNLLNDSLVKNSLLIDCDMEDLFDKDE